MNVKNNRLCFGATYCLCFQGEHTVLTVVTFTLTLKKEVAVYYEILARHRYSGCTMVQAACCRSANMQV